MYQQFTGLNSLHYFSIVDKMDFKLVGQQIKDAREAKGLSQLKVAKLTKICRASLIELEHGRKVPKWDKMLKLKEVLGLKIKI